MINKYGRAVENFKKYLKNVQILHYCNAKIQWEEHPLLCFFGEGSDVQLTF